jgi:hypothetical protein
VRALQHVNRFERCDDLRDARSVFSTSTPWSEAMNTKMSTSEKIVTGLAVAMLVAGFATGVFAKPIAAAAHVTRSSAHIELVPTLAKA